MNTPRTRPETMDGIFLDANSPTDSFVLGWLSKLQRIEPLRRNNIPVYPPTLVIGLGETGKNVLTQVKQNLLERHLGRLPQDLHLLLIESSTIAGRGMPFLDASEITNYRSDKDNQDYPSLSKRPYFEWLRDAGSQPSLRAVERTKFFMSLQSREQSVIYRTLQKSVTTFKSDPKVYLIANLNEPESSLLWDISFLLRYKVAEGFRVQMNAASLTAILAVNTGNSPSFDVGRDTFASIRELNRFLYNGFTRFIYPAPELTGIAEAALVDLCFLVDKKSSQKTPDDFYRTDESAEVVRAMSESLTILVSPDNAIHQSLQNLSEKSSTAREEYKQAFVSSIGIATIKLPVDDLRRAVELRLLRTVFFSGDSGQPGEGIIPIPWDLSKKPAPDDKLTQKKTLDFLHLELAVAHPVFAPILDVLLLGKSMGLGNLPANLDDLFISKMAEWITRELNGADSLTFASRSNRFPLVASCLYELQRLLEQAQFTLKRMEKSRIPFEQSLNIHLDHWLAVIKQADAQLKDWHQVIAGKSNIGGGERRRFSTSPRTDDGPSLLQFIESDWYKARSALSSWVRSSIRKAPIEDGNNEPPFEGLEKPFFIRYICPELSDKTGAKGDILDKFSARVGWYCKNENGLKLYLLIASVTNDPQDGLLKTSIMLYARNQLEQAYNQLVILAGYYSRGLLEERLSSYLQPGALPTIAEFLQEARDSMLPYNAMDAPVDQIGRHFLLTSDPRLAQKIENEFSHYTPQFIQQDSAVDFPQSITVISFHHIIALETTDVYVNAQKGYSFQSRAHIFVAEQHAAMVENELRNILESPLLLHPQFIRFFEVGMPADNGSTSRYLPLVNLFFKGWLFGLVRCDSALKVWHVPPVSDFQEVTVKAGGKDLLGAAREFSLNMPCSSSLHTSHPLAPDNISAYFQAFHRLLKKASASDHNQLMKQLRETDQNQIQDFLEQADPIQRSLGAYLRYIVEEEQRFGGI